MKTINWVLAGVEALLWYSFIFYFLYCIHNQTNLYTSAFILLILAYAASITCPWVRSTQAWQKMWAE